MTYRVWSKFQVKKHDGTLLKLRIQDIPENRINDAAEFFFNFVCEETFCKAAGISQNPNAIEEARLINIQAMKDPAFKNMICCEDNDDNEDNDDSDVGEIIGISSMSLVPDVGNIEEPCKALKLESKEMRTFLKLMNVMSTVYKTMEDLQISNFYDDKGLYVHPRFRKLGIAMEFLRARRLACVAHNVSATGALMTSIGTQKAAEKDNWETILEINLDEIGKEHGVTFEEGGVRKFMIWRNPHMKNQGE